MGLATPTLPVRLLWDARHLPAELILRRTIAAPIAACIDVLCQLFVVALSGDAGSILINLTMLPQSYSEYLSPKTLHS
jgi:hypothetical protein